MITVRQSIEGTPDIQNTFTEMMVEYTYIHTVRYISTNIYAHSTSVRSIMLICATRPTELYWMALRCWVVSYYRGSPLVEWATKTTTTSTTTRTFETWDTQIVTDLAWCGHTYTPSYTTRTQFEAYTIYYMYAEKCRGVKKWIRRVCWCVHHM